MLRQKYGSFINFSTIAVALALKGESVYVASKAGVEAFSRTFAREMADFNIRVNCIAPGPIKTDRLYSLVSDVEAFETTLPMKRAGQPEEIGELDRLNTSITSLQELRRQAADNVSPMAVTPNIKEELEEITISESLLAKVKKETNNSLLSKEE